MPHHLSDEVRYRVLTYVAAHPDASQRELARALGISVGKVNYCLKALVQRGWLKLQNFRRSDNKLAYAYVLTPHGLEEKINVTHAFLRNKLAEYELLSKEIEKLTAEVGELERLSEQSG